MLSILMFAAALGQAAPQALPASIHDRIEAQCAVSTVDLAGQQLARQCRAQVRAQFAAEQRALAARQADQAAVKTAAR